MVAREPGSGPHLGLVILRDIERHASLNQIPATRLEHDFGTVRPGSEKIDSRGSPGLIGGQGQAVAMWQAFQSDPDGCGVHRPVSASIAASRATRRRATSCLVNQGQDSLPLSVTSNTLLFSPPNTPEAPLTSLATIMSQFLAVSLACAFSSSFSLSAAKPMTRAGRSLDRPPIAARISGFSVSVRPEVFFGSFLIFTGAFSATRQSATAATPIKISTGSAASTCLNISRAVSR